MKRILLVGNPNSGKTTLFNTMTEGHAPTGNWPGVTVQKITDLIVGMDHAYELVDLPGIYSLAVMQEEVAEDTAITLKALQEEPWDLIINVVDANFLERHLYLTTQLLEFKRPMIIALNGRDASHATLERVCLTLENAFHVAVIPIDAVSGFGLETLKKCIKQTPRYSKKENFISLPNELAEKAKHLAAYFQAQNIKDASYVAMRWLEGDGWLRARYQNFSDPVLSTGADDDLMVADARYSKIHALIETLSLHKNRNPINLTAKIDRVVLHSYAAIPIFLMVLYGMFFFAISLGGALQGALESFLVNVFILKTADFFTWLQFPEWVSAWFCSGFGRGVVTTLTFIPIMGTFFLALSLLEASGYMARVAFVVDRFMRFLGLPGQAFVPMMVGFGCNVPAIMSTRILASKRERWLTIMMMPFMSCSARLAIYAVFAHAFFPEYGALVVFLLYLIGIGMAILTGFLLRKTLFKGELSPLLLELPPYRFPPIHLLWRMVWHRLMSFMARAGRIIIPVCTLLGGLSCIGIDGHLLEVTAREGSILAVFSQKITPFFSPMGLSSDNWPAVVALLTGFLAKEVVIGTLSALYLGAAHTMAADHSLLTGMVTHFDGAAGAFAYLLFILLYVPCISSVAVIQQETNRRLMWFSILWSFLMAYMAAVIFYQVARSYLHPWQSITWTFFLLSGVLLTITGLYFQQNRRRRTYVIRHSSIY